MPVSTPYHVGIVVADITSARSRLSELLGITWGPLLDLDAVEYRDGAGVDLTLPSRLCYSTGDTAIELMEETPGTGWVRNEHSNLHHIGFWTDQFADAGITLAAAGCPLQLCGRTGDEAPTAFAYHWDDVLGFRIELVDASMRDAMGFLFEPTSASDPG